MVKVAEEGRWPLPPVFSLIKGVPPPFNFTSQPENTQRDFSRLVHDALMRDTSSTPTPPPVSPPPPPLPASSTHVPHYHAAFSGPTSPPPDPIFQIREREEGTPPEFEISRPAPPRYIRVFSALAHVCLAELAGAGHVSPLSTLDDSPLEVLASSRGSEWRKLALTLLNRAASTSPRASSSAFTLAGQAVLAHLINRALSRCEEIPPPLLRCSPTDDEAIPHRVREYLKLRLGREKTVIALGGEGGGVVLALRGLIPLESQMKEEGEEVEEVEEGQGQGKGDGEVLSYPPTSPSSPFFQQHTLLHGGDPPVTSTFQHSPRGGGGGGGVGPVVGVPTVEPFQHSPAYHRWQLEQGGGERRAVLGISGGKQPLSLTDIVAEVLTSIKPPILLGSTALQCAPLLEALRSRFRVCERDLTPPISMFIDEGCPIVFLPLASLARGGGAAVAAAAAAAAAGGKRRSAAASRAAGDVAVSDFLTSLRSILTRVHGGKLHLIVSLHGCLLPVSGAGDVASHAAARDAEWGTASLPVSVRLDLLEEEDCDKRGGGAGKAGHPL